VKDQTRLLTRRKCYHVAIDFVRLSFRGHFFQSILLVSIVSSEAPLQLLLIILYPSDLAAPGFCFKARAHMGVIATCDS
jgi:hypothetical protein